MCIDISREERPMYHRLHCTKAMEKYTHTQTFIRHLRENKVNKLLDMQVLENDK